MQTKWYLRIVIILLAVVGMNLDQWVEPNQEIVLQFPGNSAQVDTNQEAAKLLKEQLERLGANNIRVRQNDASSITISYYSSLDIFSIKEILSEEGSLRFACEPVIPVQQPTQGPTEEDSIKYSVNIYELRKSDNIAMGSKGLLPEWNTNQELPILPQAYVSLEPTTTFIFRDTQKEVLKQSALLRLVIEAPKFEIPEVRAGPQSVG